MEDNQLWYLSIKKPITLEALLEIRKQLDNLTDQLIKERLDANSAINPSQE